MYLADRDIQMLAARGYLVDPFNENQLNPASYDICIGDSAIAESESGMDIPVDFRDTNPDHPYEIQPNEFILVATLERIIVPNGYIAECRLKSTLARQGLDQSFAFHFDPGWPGPEMVVDAAGKRIDGIGTFELKNLRQHHTIPIWRGMRIAQLLVCRTTSQSLKPYNGRYAGATSVMSAKETK